MKNKDNLLKIIKKYSADCLPYQDNTLITKGRGCYYWDSDGKKYLDFTSGIFTNSFGHAYFPLVIEGLKQSLKMNNMHGRKTKTEAFFFQELASFMPKDDYRFIPYCDGGYTVDRAINTLLNHFKYQKITIAAFKGGFHGKTLATKLLLSDSKKATFFNNVQLEYPYCYRCPFHQQEGKCKFECVQKVCQALKEKELHVLIFEAVQGSKVVIPPKKFWEKVSNFCHKNNILLFADEILTGGGRTGHFLASFGLYGIIPDIITITKGLGNGQPLSVICERDFLTQNEKSQRMWEHSSTFAKTPYALGISTKILSLLKKKKIFEHVQQMSKILSDGLENLKSLQEVGDVRCVGLMAAVEFVKDKNTKEENIDFGQKVFLKARSFGLELIPAAHIIRIAPPLNIKQKDLIKGIALLKQAITEVEKDK